MKHVPTHKVVTFCSILIAIALVFSGWEEVQEEKRRAEIDAQNRIIELTRQRQEARVKKAEIEAAEKKRHEEAVLAARTQAAEEKLAREQREAAALKQAAAEQRAQAQQEAAAKEAIARRIAEERAQVLQRNIIPGFLRPSQPALAIVVTMSDHTARPELASSLINLFNHNHIIVRFIFYLSIRYRRHVCSPSTRRSGIGVSP